MKTKTFDCVHDDFPCQGGGVPIEDVQSGIIEQAEKEKIPKQFEVVSRQGPKVVLKNKANGRKTEVPLFAYSIVRTTLRELFGGKLDE